MPAPWVKSGVDPKNFVTCTRFVILPNLLALTGMVFTCVIKFGSLILGLDEFDNRFPRPVCVKFGSWSCLFDF